MGEIDTIEKLSGQPFLDISEEDKPRGALMAAVAFVVNRRTDPNYTFDQAKNLTMSDIEQLLESDDDEKKE